MIKAVVVNHNVIEQWLQRKKQAIFVGDALDPLSPSYRLPDCIADIVNEHEANGYKLISINDATIYLRDMREFRNVVIETMEGIDNGKTTESGTGENNSASTGT